MPVRSHPPQTLAVYRSIFPDLGPRAQRRVIQILEGAIRTYMNVGIENATYANIAKSAKVSRALVQHYFKDREKIFQMVVKYIRINFQQIAVEVIKAEDSCDRQLEAYVGSLFVWIRKFPLHARVWALVYFYSSMDSKIRALHTELADMGHRRIAALLEQGAADGVFAPGNYTRRAKLIQSLYQGGGIMYLTEDLPVSKEAFRADLIRGCLNIARTALDD